ncbi:hypothetical protein VTK26DRAFT_6895 [Humicola hyalothermophila]
MTASTSSCPWVDVTLSRLPFELFVRSLLVTVLADSVLFSLVPGGNSLACIPEAEFELRSKAESGYWSRRVSISTGCIAGTSEDEYISSLVHFKLREMYTKCCCWVIAYLAPPLGVIWPPFRFRRWETARALWDVGPQQSPPSELQSPRASNDCLPPEGFFETREALYQSINAYAKPRGYAFTT